MNKPNPFAKVWNRYDDLMKQETEKNTDILFKSNYAPLYSIQGVFSHGRLNINLSDLYTFLIQEVGRFCEHYASDFLITYDSLTRVIENPNPNMKTTYRFIGIRQSGVDDIAYVLSRFTQDNPNVLTHYYRKLYALRITHMGKEKSPNHAAYVLVELRDFTGQIYSIINDIKQTGFTVNDYYQQSDDEKAADILSNLHQMQSYIRKIQDYREGTLEDIRNMKNPPVAPSQLSFIRENLNQAYLQLNAAMEQMTPYLKERDENYE